MDFGKAASHDLVTAITQLDPATLQDNEGSGHDDEVQRIRTRKNGSANGKPWRRRSVQGEDGAQTLEQKLGLVDSEGRSWFPDWLAPRKLGSLFVAFLVFTNMVVIGLEVDLGNMRRPAEAWVSIDALFAVIFVFELAIRIVADGYRPPAYLKYFVAPLPPLPLNRDLESATERCLSLVRWIWYIRIYNTIDACLVLCRLIDFTLTLSEASSDAAGCAEDPLMPCSVCICRSNGRLFVKLVTAIRIIRVGFAIQHYRLVRAVRELWLIMAGLRDVVKTITWVFLLLLMVVWVFSIFMAVSIGHNDDVKAHLDYSESEWNRDDYWDSTSTCLYTLFEVITMDKWSHSIAWPLVRRYPIFILPFIFFLCMTVICLLNLITGVVVETTLSSAQANAEREGKEMARTYKRVTESLEQLFVDADQDGNGGLDRDELNDMMKIGKIRDRLRMLDIPAIEMDRLFTLLDDRDEGIVPIDKFFRGTARLRGEAKSCDLNQMSVDLHRHIATTRDFTENLVDCNDTLTRLVDFVDTVDREIIRGDDDEKDPVLKARRGRAQFGKRQAKTTMPNYYSDDDDFAKGRKTSLVRHALRSKERSGKAEPDAGDERKGSKTSTGDERKGSKRSNRSNPRFHWGTI